jgi:hypothetical protein
MFIASVLDTFGQVHGGKGECINVFGMVCSSFCLFGEFGYFVQSECSLVMSRP